MNNIILEDIQIGDELILVDTQEKAKVIKIEGNKIYYQETKRGNCDWAYIEERN